jgi:protein TonB
MKHPSCIGVFLLLALAGRTAAQQKSSASSQKGSTIVYDTLSKPDSKMVYTYVGRMPEFDTKKNGPLDAYLSNRISLLEGNLEVIPFRKVVVQFLVGERGNISEPKIIRSAGRACDSIAVCLVQEMPDWIPGRNDEGKAIPVKYILPIRVSLE